MVRLAALALLWSKFNCIIFVYKQSDYLNFHLYLYLYWNVYLCLCLHLYLRHRLVLVAGGTGGATVAVKIQFSTGIQAAALRRLAALRKNSSSIISYRLASSEQSRAGRSKLTIQYVALSCGDLKLYKLYNGLW